MIVPILDVLLFLIGKKDSFTVTLQRAPACIFFRVTLSPFLPPFDTGGCVTLGIKKNIIIIKSQNSRCVCSALTARVSTGIFLLGTGEPFLVLPRLLCPWVANVLTRTADHPFPFPGCICVGGEGGRPVLPARGAERPPLPGRLRVSRAAPGCFSPGRAGMR